MLLYRVGLSAIQHLVTETFVTDHKEKKSLFKNKQFCDKLGRHFLCDLTQTCQ